MSSRLSIGNDSPNNASRSHFLFLVFIDLPTQFLVEDKVQICIVYSGRNCTYVDYVQKNCTDAQKQGFVPWDLEIPLYSRHMSFWLARECFMTLGWMVRDPILMIICHSDKMKCNRLPPKVRSHKNLRTKVLYHIKDWIRDHGWKLAIINQGLQCNIIIITEVGIPILRT